MNSIVFLDVDGTAFPLDRSLVTKVHERIAFLLDTTDAKIVFTTDWRRNPGITPSQLLKQLIECADTKWLNETHLFSLEPELGFTPQHASHDHTTEIKEYINTHNVENFCILDDIEPCESLKDKWVYVDYRDGVTWRDVAKASIVLIGSSIHVEQRFW